MFSYQEFTTRNLGFVSEDEQAKLRKACVFFPGVGGMGGTALECLARTGIGEFIIADIDVFEISNLNRQIFSDLKVIDRPKAEVAREKLLQINPELKIQVYGKEWIEQLPQILDKCDLVINGCDDVKATIHLMREAKKKNKTVIDAYASTLPSVYVVKASDPRPETTFGFPTLNLSLEQITPEIQKECAGLEMHYVLTHSSTAQNVILNYAAEMITGKRKRISLAPMVWMTGLLMSYEALKILLGRPGPADYRGVFLNPWNHKFERPFRGPMAWIRKFLVGLFLKKLAA